MIVTDIDRQHIVAVSDDGRHAGQAIQVRPRVWTINARGRTRTTHRRRSARRALYDLIRTGR